MNSAAHAKMLATGEMPEYIFFDANKLIADTRKGSLDGWKHVRSLHTNPLDIHNHPNFWEIIRRQLIHIRVPERLPSTPVARRDVAVVRECLLTLASALPIGSVLPTDDWVDEGRKKGSLTGIWNKILDDLPRTRTAIGTPGTIPISRSVGW
jgi:hypothetical protein